MNSLFDRDEFIHGWKIMFPENEPVEIRIIGMQKKGSPLSGYFCSPEAAAYALERTDLSGSAVFWTINQLHPGCFARIQREKLMAVSPTTSDSDIIMRRWLPIDIDPDRPSGCSSSNEEYKAAYTLAQKIAETLTKQGWPNPLKVYSGNGAHLLFPMKLENKKQTAKEHENLVGACLEDLAQRFDTENVHIDLTVKNAARIMKCPGTFACKGYNAPDRPWRMARLFKDCQNYQRPTEVIEL